MKTSSSVLRCALLGAAAIVSLSLGCATAPKAPPKLNGVFFPPAPDLPRIQFLAAYSGRKDVESQSSFNKFVVGEQPDVKLDKPYGVGVYDGRIYVCDTNASVVVFDLVQHSFHLLDGATGPGQLVAPVNITITPDGSKYVADPGRGQIVVFGKDDQFVRAYGEPGNWRPVDALVDSGRLYVADSGNAMVRVFDLASGGMVKTIGDKGEPKERLSIPTNLALDAKGYLYVSDVGRFQIFVFDRDGHYQRKIGGAGDNLGHFARPKGIAIDRDGHLFAVDASFNNVQMFDDQGRLLMAFGEPGKNEGQLQLPAKVVVDYDNLKFFQQYVAPGFDLQYVTLVTSQFGPRLVSVYGYGRARGRTYPSDDELRAQAAERKKKELEKLQQAPAPAAPGDASAPENPAGVAAPPAVGPPTSGPSSAAAAAAAPTSATAPAPAATPQATPPPPRS